jgi:hypothetical protein
MLTNYEYLSKIMFKKYLIASLIDLIVIKFDTSKEFESKHVQKSVLFRIINSFNFISKFK